MNRNILAAILFSASTQLAKSWPLNEATTTYTHDVRAQVTQTIETGGSMTSPNGEILRAENLAEMREWAIAHAREIELFELLRVSVGHGTNETELIGATWAAMQDVAEGDGILDTISGIRGEIDFEREYRVKKHIAQMDDLDALETFFKTKFDPTGFEIASFLERSRKEISLAETRLMAQKTLDYVRGVGDTRDFDALEAEKETFMHSVEVSRTRLGYSLKDLQEEAGEREAEQRAREYLEKHAPGLLMPPPKPGTYLPTQNASPNEQRV